MKKTFLILTIGLALSTTGFAQAKKSTDKSVKKESKKEAKSDAETTDERHERHKEFWKKVGNDQKDFWKGEHERHVANKEAGEKAEGSSAKKSERLADDREGPRKPPPPPNPFKKKKKEKETED